MMNDLEQDWCQEVSQSRICIVSGKQSYLPEANVMVWTVIEKLAQGETEWRLMNAYPGLTKADIRACQLFTYLRTVGRL